MEEASAAVAALIPEEEEAFKNSQVESEMEKGKGNKTWEFLESSLLM